MKTNLKKVSKSLALIPLLVGSSLFATLEFTPAEDLTLDGNGSAFKTKLVRMGNGLLVSVYGDSVPSEKIVYDLKADDQRKARDIFARTCMPVEANGFCSKEVAWSEAVNLSNTADLSSISSGWEIGANGDVLESPFYGDSEKPNIFNSGTFAVVTWVDKYCPGNKQRKSTYLERDGIQIPFACVYESHINFASESPTWFTKQLTLGERDAKQDVNKGVSSADKKGQWIITWQEDPTGLQIGGGDGPGEGASGAGTSHGTDIWYTMTSDLMNSPFTDIPKRLTDNQTKMASNGNFNPVFDHDGTAIAEVESGNSGASRANTGVVQVSDGEAFPTVIVTYEETKGSDKLDNGKYVRYHSFSFDNPEEKAAGAIISDPTQNARRVRFVPQTNAATNGLRMGIFWRQGEPTEGGPGDIMVRLGFKDSTDANSSGLKIEDFRPSVDHGAAVTDYADAILLNNTPALNISSNTIPWSEIGGENGASTNTLEDTTILNPYEDARAHRAAIRGDDFYIGYSYAKDWAVATYTNMDNYNFWMRRYNSADDAWTNALNVSNIDDVKIHAKEPRLVGMPGNGPGCTDPLNITNPENCQSKSTLLIGWGVETNVYSHIGGSEEGDIYYTRTFDKGESFEDPIVVVAGGENSNRFESQLRSTPAGNYVFTVWNDHEKTLDTTRSMLSVSANGETIIDDVPTSTVTYNVTVSSEIPVSAGIPESSTNDGEGNGGQGNGQGANQGQGEGLNDGAGKGNQGLGQGEGLNDGTGNGGQGKGNKGIGGTKKGSGKGRL